jgi:hypothetical protein
LEDALSSHALQGISLVPVTEDAVGLWDTWVGMGGEGIVLKDRHSLYRPGVRSPAWLKLKPKLTIKMTITGGSAERIAWGDWGEAMNLELAYDHPRTGARVEIAQAVRIPKAAGFELSIGGQAEIVCWGVMPSGMLRHPLLVTWRE